MRTYPTAEGIEMLDRLKRQLASAKEFRRKRGRPFVILTYAQSLDGSIAARDRRQVRLSGAASMTLTHRLRSCSDAISSVEEIIEDALGLKVYQLKKQEAERKLERTRENIAQVESLRREAAPHLKYLKKRETLFRRLFLL